MYQWLEPKSPVFEGLEREQINFGLHQPQYRVLRVLEGSGPEHKVVSRWALTAAQRKIITDGGDIYLEMLTFGKALMPVLLAVSDGNNSVEWVRTVLLGKAPQDDSSTSTG
jgi:hypothetical protein